MTAPHPPAWGALFDWDGVLVDSSRFHELSWEALAREGGLHLPEGHFRRGYGMKNEQIIPDLLRWTQDPAEVERLSLRKEVLFRELVRRHGIGPLPGVRVIENVYARNLDVGSVAAGTNRAAFLIEFTYMNSTTGPYVPVLRNVNVTGVCGADIPRLVSLTAGSTAVIENIRIDDSIFAGPAPAELEQNKGRITFTNVTLLPRGTALPAAKP